jgi:hypothetical protein
MWGAPAVVYQNAADGRRYTRRTICHDVSRTPRPQTRTIFLVAADFLVRNSQPRRKTKTTMTKKIENDDDADDEGGYSERRWKTWLDFAQANGGRREPSQSYQCDFGSPGVKISISRILSMSPAMVCSWVVI